LFDLVAGEKPRLVAHPDRHFHQAHPIEVLHEHGVGMIALLRVVAAHEHEVVDADRGRAEHVGL
jgi:hypothetical protein